MIRLRHILSTDARIKLMFRNYFAEASKIESPDNAEITDKFENVGKWICTFSHTLLIKGKIKKKVVIMGSKKKVIAAFKKFILFDFAASNKSKDQNDNNAQIFENVNLVIDDILTDIRNLRNAVNEKNVIKVNTLIENAIIALNILQTKLSELGEFDANKKDK